MICKYASKNRFFFVKMSRNSKWLGVSNLDFLKMLITMGVIMNESNSDNNNNTDNNNVIIFDGIDQVSGQHMQVKVTKIEDKFVNIETKLMTNGEIITRNAKVCLSFDVLKEIIDSMSSYPKFQTVFLTNVITSNIQYKKLTDGLTNTSLIVKSNSIDFSYIISKNQREIEVAETFHMEGITRTRTDYSIFSVIANTESKQFEYIPPFDFKKLHDIILYCKDDYVSIYLLICTCHDILIR